MSKKLCMLLMTVASILCLCFGLAACGGSGDSDDAFSAPTNVKVENHTLSWTAVSGAEEYTVKINSDETTKVTTTSLDLTTATVIAKLVSGNNTLSVKANATEDKDASAYSTSVTYNYTPSQEPSNFDKLTITLSGSTISWTAVNGATNGYTVKINEATTVVTTASYDLLSDTSLLVPGDNTVSVKVNAVGDIGESEYSNEETYDYDISAAQEAQEFIAAVNAIGAVTADTDLTAAKAKYEALSDDAKEVSGVSEAIATLIQKDCAVFAAKVDLIETVTISSTASELTAAEAAIAAAEAYYEALIDNTDAQTAKDLLDVVSLAYDLVIEAHEATVTALKEEIEEMELTGTIPPEKVTLEYYNRLYEVKAEIEELDDYCATLWAANYSDLTTAVENEIAELERIIEESRTALDYTSTGMVIDNTTGTITFGAGYNTTKLAEQFQSEDITADNVHEQLRFIIDVTLNGVTKTFTLDCTANMTNINGEVLKLNIYSLFQDNEATEYTLQLRLALREGSPYSFILKDSEKTAAKEWNISVALQLSINFGNADNKVTLDATEEQSSDWNFGRWEILDDEKGYHDGVTLFIYEVTAEIQDSVDSYDFLNDATPFATYLYSVKGYIKWSEINSAINAVWGKLSSAQKTNTKQFVFMFQKLANDAGKAAGYTDSDVVYATKTEGGRSVVTYTRDWSVPSGIQLRFTTNNNGCFEFLRENQPSGQGSVFDEQYGVLYIEIQFTVGNNSYSAYLYNEGGTLKIYANTSKTGSSLTCGDYNNGWLYVSDFNSFVNNNNAEYAEISDFDIKSGEVEFKTKIVHDDSYYVGEGDFSSPVTYPEETDN